MDGQLKVERDGAVATITIANPARRNSLTLPMWQAFEPLLDELAHDAAVKVVVLRGAEGNFSAGADIASLASILDPDAGPGGWVTRAEEAIVAFPKPTVAAIEGFCFGGGWEIAGACDLRLSTITASYAITPARIGIIYPLSGIRRLVALVGPASARHLLFTGNTVSATEAHAMGMVTTMVPDEYFAHALASLCSDVSARSQLSIRATKQIIDAIVGNDSNLDGLYQRWSSELERSSEPSIGAAAFSAREQPRFTWNGDNPTHRRHDERSVIRSSN